MPKKSKKDEAPGLTEEQEQRIIFEWASYFSGQFPPLRLLHHIPNGGYRLPATAVKMKAAGVKPGVPDICLPVSRKGYHGLYIELKRAKGGTVSAAQMEWLEALEAGGYFVAVCHGAEEAIATIQEYLRD